MLRIVQLSWCLSHNESSLGSVHLHTLPSSCLASECKLIQRVLKNLLFGSIHLMRQLEVSTKLILKTLTKFHSCHLLGWWVNPSGFSGNNIFQFFSGVSARWPGRNMRYRNALFQGLDYILAKVSCCKLIQANACKMKNDVVGGNSVGRSPTNNASRTGKLFCERTHFLTRYKHELIQRTA